MAYSRLLAAVQAALGSAVTLGYSSSAKAHDVYEAYVLSLFVRAARNQGWFFTLRDTAGNPTTNAVFRLAPGRLPSGGFTHVHLVKFGKQPLEAHLGVKVYGKSLRKVSKGTKSGHLLHEFDLLVLSSAAAAVCRTTYSDPAYSDAVVHAEAKFYGGNLPLPLGRASVGMALECDLADKSILVTNQNGLTVQDLVEAYRVTFRFLVTPSNSKAEWFLTQRFEGMLLGAP